MANNTYEYQICTEENRQEIIDFLLKHFFTEEPLNRASRMSEAEFLKVASPIVDTCLKVPFSTVVRCKELNTIAGVLLISIYNRTDGKHDMGFEDEKDSSVSAVGAILNELHNSFFDLVPNHVNRVLHREISSVGKPYQRQGIATKMMNFSFSRENLEKYKIDGIISETSSLANQKLLAKHGFKSLKVIRLSDVKNSHGQQLLETDDGTEEAVLNWKPIGELNV